ncbi:ribosomal protein S18-alanine N-acetyltransferase [Algihabitans albus]|uniref:ribosomal protein S18-alanine N-acetyltransferase n=1 Tax=Algihabitans albus TaxID=2164067 RepID=UPI001ABC5110|nr:ribosomal protein S18-alanine N-acetyltransferase [Algihabitans albus]
MKGSYRALTALDLPVLECLHHESFPEAPWSARSFGELLALPGTGGLLAHAGLEPLGFLLWHRVTDEAEVLALCVRPAARRRAFARTLLRRAMTAFPKTEIRRVFLEVAEDNAAARALYKGLGFREIGRRRGYYRRPEGTKTDALLLEITLTDE